MTPRQSTGGAKAQVRRLLALLPYLLAHPGARVADVARVFGISEKQLVADLGVLWFCGLPGMMPGDYIEVDMDAVHGEGVIHVSNADYLARPLRLSADEALGLLVALRVLREMGRESERELVDRVIARLEEAVGHGDNAVDKVAVRLDSVEDPAIRTAVRDALDQKRRLHLRYWVPARDETTERDVDPMRLVLADGWTYLEGWCHKAKDVRLFRLDRMVEARVLDEPASPPPDARPRDLSHGAFQPSAATAMATLELDPSAAWVAEYYPCEEVTEAADGSLRVRLRVADPRWLRRLALRLGGSARIVEPAELADAVRADAARALEAYGSV
ncbi:helix-turn-helix transcriptional regulator [Thermasporomyces composti]|uniref:Proteasome accessory factor C n=1 Tax=Thermasporomyces composti TaxID=696763 RepID=A0A3D9V9C6_THECX|nr:WYL domain-containing protein [Thermasporomyces composti]REF38362.1 proteasome accessory factor C [Thermasporomyces composti]